VKSPGTFDLPVWMDKEAELLFMCGQSTSALQTYLLSSFAHLSIGSLVLLWLSFGLVLCIFGIIIFYLVEELEKVFLPSCRLSLHFGFCFVL
jgi:hypothetical protein